MSDLTEQDLAALDPAGYWEDKYELAKDRIEQLEAVVDAAKAYEAERYHDTWLELHTALAALQEMDDERL